MSWFAFLFCFFSDSFCCLLPSSSFSTPSPNPYHPVLFEDFQKEKWNLNTLILICWNAIEDKEGLGLCLLNCQPMLNVVLIVSCVAWDFSVLWPWTWRGYQNSFCSININCTLGSVLHLFYGSVWRNFSPKSASQRSVLRFWRKQTGWEMMRMLWSLRHYGLCQWSCCVPSAFFLCHLNIDACPVDLFSRRVCFCQCLVWPLAIRI